jgi:hypothetical protein
MEISDRPTAWGLFRDEIEVFVVAFDPVQRGPRPGIFTALAREITRAHPECNFGMTRHDAIERFEIAVQISDGTELHYRI